MAYSMPITLKSRGIFPVYTPSVVVPVCRRVKAYSSELYRFLSRGILIMKSGQADQAFPHSVFIQIGWRKLVSSGISLMSTTPRRKI